MTTVGTNLRRIDGTEKIGGHALYAGDLRFPGMAHAKVLRSPLAHARIRLIDATKAGALPGVLAVLTRDNLNVVANSFGAYVRDQQILATEKVRYAGDMWRQWRPPIASLPKRPSNSSTWSTMSLPRFSPKAWYPIPANKRPSNHWIAVFPAMTR